MRLKGFLLMGLVFLLVFAGSCKKDDDNSFPVIPERDRAEQTLIDDDSLRSFLETHFYNYEEFQSPPAGFDYKVRFDTIAGENSDKTPIMESPLLEEKEVTWDDVDYTVYILKIREGEGTQPTFADSTYVTYRGQLLNGEIFDATVTPVWFDLPSVLPGFTEGVIEFRGATGFVINPDNTIAWNNDYGIGAVFMPSGLAYYSLPPITSNIPQYSPLIFGLELYGKNEADHDHDGVPSYLEDIDGDGFLADDFDDDTNGNFVPDYLDVDDDGDGDLTSEEIVINEDGTISYPDTDGDGIPDYLDAE